MTMRTPLSKVRGLGSAKDGTMHFWYQRITALANVPLVLFFIGIVIYLQNSNYEDAKELITSPYVAIPLILMLFNSFFHMKLGMQIVIEDYVHQPLIKQILLFLNIAFPFTLGAMCTYAIIKLLVGS